LHQGDPSLKLFVLVIIVYNIPAEPRGSLAEALDDRALRGDNWEIRVDRAYAIDPYFPSPYHN